MRRFTVQIIIEGRDCANSVTPSCHRIECIRSIATGKLESAQQDCALHLPGESAVKGHHGYVCGLSKSGQIGVGPLFG